MDFEQFGEDSMKEDGVRQTEFGLVRRLSSPFDGPDAAPAGVLSGVRPWERKIPAVSISTAAKGV